MDYLLWRKKAIGGPELDRDPYRWLIWYNWKARNDKLFRGIDRDPLELARYAESERIAWFQVNEQGIEISEESGDAERHVICLRDIYMIGGSWISIDQFSGCGWEWKDNTGNTQLMGLPNVSRVESALHSELEALRWAMENMLQYLPCQSFGTDCKELIAMLSNPHEWPSFSTELERLLTLRICFPDFNIVYVPRSRNVVSDRLAKTARSFYRELMYVGCSIPVWIPRPPQA